MIDDAIETSRPLTAISRRAAQPKPIDSPVSRTTRMPTHLLAPGLAVVPPLTRHQDWCVGEQHDEVGEEAEDAGDDRSRVAAGRDRDDHDRQDHDRDDQYQRNRSRWRPHGCPSSPAAGHSSRGAVGSAAASPPAEPGRRRKACPLDRAGAAGACGATGYCGAPGGRCSGRLWASGCLRPLAPAALPAAAAVRRRPRGPAADRVAGGSPWRESNHVSPMAGR